jgi:class 3 adenylate cyclase
MKENIFIQNNSVILNINTKDNKLIEAFLYELPGSKSLIVEYKFKNNESYMFLATLVNGIESQPEEIADKICKKLNVDGFQNVKKIQKNSLEVYVPYFMRKGHVTLNYPEIEMENRKIFSEIDGYCAVVDIRGFSTWALSVEGFDCGVVNNLLHRLTEDIFLECPLDFWKMLGDGVMLVWEGNAKSESIAKAMIEFRKEYKNDNGPVKNQNQHPPKIGISICKGELVKYEMPAYFKTCIVRDYLGILVNTATRIQSLSELGEIIVNKDFATEFSDISKHEQIDKSKYTDKLKGVPPEELIYKLNEIKGETND